MAFINVAEWTPENVAQWLQGLEDCILPYVNFFLNNQINGCRLLLLSSEDLTKLNVTKIGHQEIILDGVELLKHLHYNFNSETLQSLALRLACKSRSLYNQLTLEKNEAAKLNLKQNNGSTNNSKNSSKSSQNAISKLSSKENKNSKNNSNNSSQKNLAKNLLESNLTNTSNKVSTKTLFAVCDILNAAKTFVSWIDRYPFEGQDVYKPIRKTILKLSIELASTSQRDQFVDHPNEIILTNCLTFAGLCERIVQDLHDSLAIQPASLDVALIKKRPDEELGMHIHSSYSGIHIISGIKLSSATNNCGRIDEGDEIVQVNYRTVVGWQLRKLVDIVKEYQTELVLTLKKRPKHSVSNGQINVAKPFKLPLKEYSANQNVPINKEILSGSMTLRHKPRKMLPNEDFDNEYCNLIGLSQMQIDPQNSTASLSKSKTTLRRRATISGSSNSVNSCGIVRVDDLLIKNHQNSYKIQNELKQQQISQDNQSTNNNLPYAKVQPLNSVNDENSKAQQNKQGSTFCITNSSNGKAIAVIKSQSENVGIVLPNINRSNNSKSPQSLKLSTFQPENNKQENLNVSTETISSSKPPPPPSRKNNNFALGEKPAVPMRPASISNHSNSTNNLVSNSSLTVNLNRLVTLKQIEEENSKFFDQNPESTLCQLINKNNSSTNNNTIDKTSSLNKECNNLLSGWLYTKRENFNTLLNAKAKWTAKYVQLSTNYLLYAFKNEHATKADLVINLAAFKVSPACECKTKDHVFKTFNKHAIFLFSCESQFQMRHWVDTLRQLVSNCASTKPELMKISMNPDVACYSETEDEEDVIDDEMVLQNFANELVETNEREQQEKETIKTEIDLIKTEVEINTEKPSVDDQLTPQKKIDSKNLINSENKSITNEEEDEEEEKHNRRMMRLLNRRRQRYTSTADSYRDSSPSSTSSASSSANNSVGQVVLSRFAAISELREKLQKQAQEKLEHRKLALASGNKMYNRSVSCMDPSSINNLRERLNTTLTKNNTSKDNLTRNKFSGSQQSLVNSTFKETNNVPNKNEKLPVKPFFMTNKNKVLPPIPHLPPRPPKPSSISMNNSINETTINTIDQTNIYTELNDELKKSQPLPQPRNSKNAQSAAVEDEKQLAEEIINKENINVNNKISDTNTNNDNILRKTLSNKLEEQKPFIGNHKDNEYISSIIDELYNFPEETKPEPVISKPIMQQESELAMSCTAPTPSTSSYLMTNAFEKNNLNQNNSNMLNNPNMMNFDQNYSFNQMNEQSVNSQNAIPHQLQSMLMTGNRQVQMLDDDLDYLDDEECLDDEEEDEEYSDEEDEEDESEFNDMLNSNYNSLQSQKTNTNYNTKPEQSNIFSLGSELNSLQPSVSNNYTAANGNVDFLAPGPNFLNSAPGLSNNQKTSSVNNNQDFHLGSSSNSNNYPSSSSANSFNISPYSSISQHQQSNCSPTQPLDNGFNSQVNNVFNKVGGSADEQLSDSSSGVSSYVSAMAEIQSAEYLKVLQIIHQQQLANLPPEAQQQFAQQFQEQFQQHFQYQLQLQLQQQLLAQQQGQQPAQQQLFNPQQVNLENQQNINQVNGAFNQLQDGLMNNQSNQQQEELLRQMMAGRMEMEDLEDDLSETDSDLSCGSLDEEDEEDDIEDFQCQEGGNKKPDKKTGRKSSFRLFGSPKLLKKLTTLKHQKEKRSIGNSMARNNSITDNRDDTTSVWISMGDKMLDDENDFVMVGKNDSDGKPSMDNKVDVVDMTKASVESPFVDEELESSNNQMSDSKINVNDKNIDKNNSKTMTSKVEDNTSLNSSQSSFVQISTKDSTSTLTKEKPLQKSSSSLSNKWFSKIKNRNPETKINETKKQLSVKNAPQITQVIYKRRPALPQPKIPEKIAEIKKPNNEKIKKVESSLITVPDDDDKEAEEDTIYAEINETQLVLEEMRRSLDRHSTERKIIEMILQQPSSIQENKINRVTDQLKVK